MCIMCIWKCVHGPILLHLNVFPAKTAIRYFIHSCMIDMCFVASPLTFLVVFLVDPLGLNFAFDYQSVKFVVSYEQGVFLRMRSEA